MLYQTFYSLLNKAVLCVLVLLTVTQLTADEIYVVNSQSRTLSRIDTQTDLVQNNFAQLGLIPNKVIIDENYLWSVNSGDNALQKIDRVSGATLAHILIEAGCNPWDAVLHEAYLYVTGLFTNKVYKVHSVNHAVIGSVDVGISPEALCVYNTRLYVTNTGGYQNNYANSSVSVIDLAGFTVLDTIPVSANPQYITEHNGLLHVSCTGNWGSVAGAICIIDPATNEVIQTLDMGGSPGNIRIQNETSALVSDAGGINLYRYNPLTCTILNGSANPLPYGGSVVDGTGAYAAVLNPNWGSNGKVFILHPDLSYWKEYSVGLMPTDLKIRPGGTSLIDNEVPSASMLSLYPNPARRRDVITLKSTAGAQGEVTIYNLKGQRICKLTLQDGTARIQPGSPLHQAGSGCYLYRLNGTSQSITGKFLLLD